jgi:hypothetical protein
MWKIIKAVLLRWLLARTFGKGLGLLAVLIPLGAVLKAVGVPLVIALVLLGLPVLLLLTLLGVPLPIAALAALALTTIAGLVLALGFAILKVALPILLVVWLVKWLFFDRGKRGERSEPGPDMI